MQSAYIWSSLVVAVVLIVLLVAVVVLLRRTRRQPPTPPPRPPAAPDGPDNRPAVPADPVAVPGPVNGVQPTVGHPPRPVDVPPAGLGEPMVPGTTTDLPRRTQGRNWPAASPGPSPAARTDAALPVLHGTVRGDDGTVLANAVLTVINVTGGQAGSARTDVNGSYRLTLPGEGGYVLIARGVNHEPHASTVVVRGRYTAFDIKLTSAAGLGGLVTDPDGTAVPDATVILTNTTGVVVSAQRTNVQGGYTVTDLAPGLYTVTAAAEGFDPVATLVDVPQSGMVRQDVTFPPRRVSLRGVAIHQDDGRPLADVRVRLLDAADRPVATIHTGPDGRYEFSGLGPGRYTLVASGYPEVSSPVELTDSTDQGAAGHEHPVRMGHRPGVQDPVVAPTGADAAAPSGGGNSGTFDEERGR